MESSTGNLLSSGKRNRDTPLAAFRTGRGCKFLPPNVCRRTRWSIRPAGAWMRALPGNLDPSIAPRSAFSSRRHKSGAVPVKLLPGVRAARPSGPRHLLVVPVASKRATPPPGAMSKERRTWPYLLHSPVKQVRRAAFRMTMSGKPGLLRTMRKL